MKISLSVHNEMNIIHEDLFKIVSKDWSFRMKSKKKPPKFSEVIVATIEMNID